MLDQNIKDWILDYWNVICKNSVVKPLLFSLSLPFHAELIKLYTFPFFSARQNLIRKHCLTGNAAPPHLDNFRHQLLNLFKFRPQEANKENYHLIRVSFTLYFFSLSIYISISIHPSLYLFLFVYLSILYISLSLSFFLYLSPSLWQIPVLPSIRKTSVWCVPSVNIEYIIWKGENIKLKDFF